MTHPNAPANPILIPRLDGEDKVKGVFPYANDLAAPEMLWGSTIRSPYPSAHIRGISVAEAAAVPGVRAVLTARDVPGRPLFGAGQLDQPVLAAECVRYAGEPVAILAAEDAETARRAARLVDVDYDPLEPVTDPVDALASHARQVHAHGNELRTLNIERGDPDAPADVWEIGHYETARQDPSFLAPESALAIPGVDGSLDLFAATQWLHSDRRQVAASLGVHEDQVRVHLAGVGGAFGGREDVTLQIHVCLLAAACGRPVKMIYTRRESFHAHVHRHPARMWLRHGANRDGQLVSIRARVILDGGAYASSSGALVTNVCAFLTGPYEVPNVWIRGTVAYTNNPPSGAMRGFGVPQACFAHEAQMDRLAARLDMDPVQLRMINALHHGSTLPTGQVVTGVAPVTELLERCSRAPLAVDDTSRDPADSRRRGTGYAAGIKSLAQAENFDVPSEARIVLHREDKGLCATVHTAAAEVGQGILSLVAHLVHSELGISDVRIREPNTHEVGSDGGTMASRQTIMTGGAVLGACQEVRRELFRRLRDDFGFELPPTTKIHNDCVLLDATRSVSIASVLSEPIDCTHVHRHRPTEKLDEHGQGNAHVAFAFAVHRAEVEVDVDVGTVEVVQLVAAHDVGRAMNPRSVRGQIAGGIGQGLGLALLEELDVRDGVLQNPSFANYLLPVASDMPKVLYDLVEIPDPDLPFGAKGVGEPSTVVSTAAIAAAVRNATGRTLSRVPIHPEDVVGTSPPSDAPRHPPDLVKVLGHPGYDNTRRKR